MSQRTADQSDPRAPAPPGPAAAVRTILLVSAIMLFLEWFERAVPEVDSGYVGIAQILLVVSLASYSLRSSHRRFSRLLSRSTELTDRLTEREAEARKLAIVASRTTNAVVVTDPDGRIEWVNDGFVRITGYTLPEVLGKRPGQFLQGPDTDPDTVARIRNALRARQGFRETILNYTRTGRPYWLEIEVQPVFSEPPRPGDPPELVHFVAIETDVTERIETAERLKLAALTDALTGLPNRTLLTDRLVAAIGRKTAQPDSSFALLYLDLDNFKRINDSLGHTAGDRLLRAVADVLRSATSRPGESPVTIARLGGDEFAVLLDRSPTLADAERAAARILLALAKPLDLDGNDVLTSASVGITTSDHAYAFPVEVLRDADLAMYAAKSAGRGRHQVFDRSFHECAVNRLRTECDLRHALVEEQLRLHYQPTVCLTTGRLTGFEALVRWHHPTRGLISPAEFIPLAEETGLILPLGNWVLHEAARQLADWRRRFPVRCADLHVAVNLSRRQLVDTNLLRDIDAVLNATGLPAECLNLEITESMVMENAAAVSPLLQALRQRGLSLHMDDFGTGYSSLACLHRFPLACLKIDRAFILNSSSNRDYAAVIQAIIHLAHALGMTVTAEGVETDEHVALLQALECDTAQGYYFHKPLTPEFAELLLATTAEADSLRNAA